MCNPKHKLYHLFPGGTCKCHLYHCHRKYVIFQDFTEKNIKINLQKPHNTTKGFGFSISGGVEKKQPITVYKVNIGRSNPTCCRPWTQVTHPAPDRLIPMQLCRSYRVCNPPKALNNIAEWIWEMKCISSTENSCFAQRLLVMYTCKEPKPAWRNRLCRNAYCIVRKYLGLYCGRK